MKSSKYKVHSMSRMDRLCIKGSRFLDEEDLYKETPLSLLTELESLIPKEAWREGLVYMIRPGFLSLNFSTNTFYRLKAAWWYAPDSEIDREYLKTIYHPFVDYKYPTRLEWEAYRLCPNLISKFHLDRFRFWQHQKQLRHIRLSYRKLKLRVKR